MKIVGVDNFDRDDVADQLVEIDLTHEEAKRRCAELNAKGGMGAPRFYEVWPDDKKLRTNADIYS